MINTNDASYVNLRSVKTMKGDDTVLTHVKVGNTVTLLRREGNRYLVSYKDYVGYMHKSFPVID